MLPPSLFPLARSLHTGTEALGGVHANVVSLFRRLHARASGGRHHDRTRYGLSRTATRSFHTHHLRLLSLSIATSVAESVDAHASLLHSRLLDDRFLDADPATANDTNRAAASPRDDAL